MRFFFESKLFKNYNCGILQMFSSFQNNNNHEKRLRLFYFLMRNRNASMSLRIDIRTLLKAFKNTKNLQETAFLFASDLCCFFSSAIT